MTSKSAVEIQRLARGRSMHATIQLDAIPKNGTAQALRLATYWAVQAQKEAEQAYRWAREILTNERNV